MAGGGETTGRRARTRRVVTRELPGVHGDEPALVAPLRIPDLGAERVLAARVGIHGKDPALVGESHVLHDRAVQRDEGSAIRGRVGARTGEEHEHVGS